jgi:hypothetical protein
MTGAVHSEVKPFYLKYKDEEIRVTLSRVDRHFKRDYPYFLSLQRYIVGRPNLLKIPIYPVQEDKSMHFNAGAKFHYYIKELYVWSFIDKYPPRIEVNCEDLTPSLAIKIGDVEKMLPYGMFLHKMYDHRKSDSIVKLTLSNLYMQRKNMINEQAEAIKDHRKKMQTTMAAEKNREATKSKAAKKPEKSVPQVVVSSKFITAEKKESEKEAKSAEGKK